VSGDTGGVDIAYSLLFPPACACGWWAIFRLLLRTGYSIPQGWFCVALAILAYDSFHGDIPGAAAAGASVAVAAWLWWKSSSRGKRKRAAALLGAKSRALRDALVRKAREAGTPRRVLQPVPVGR
jgi:hypothetical protein